MCRRDLRKRTYSVDFAFLLFSMSPLLCELSLLVVCISVSKLLIALSGADFFFFFIFYVFKKLGITSCVENQKILYSAHFKTSFPLLQNPLNSNVYPHFFIKIKAKKAKNLEDFLFLMEGMVNALVESPKHSSLLGPIFSVSSQVLE